MSTTRVNGHWEQLWNHPEPSLLHWASSWSRPDLQEFCLWLENQDRYARHQEEVYNLSLPSLLQFHSPLLAHHCANVINTFLGKGITVVRLVMAYDGTLSSLLTHINFNISICPFVTIYLLTFFLQAQSALFISQPFAPFCVWLQLLTMLLFWTTVTSVSWIRGCNCNGKPLWLCNLAALTLSNMADIKPAIKSTRHCWPERYFCLTQCCTLPR